MGMFEFHHKWNSNSKMYHFGMSNAKNYKILTNWYTLVCVTFYRLGPLGFFATESRGMQAKLNRQEKNSIYLARLLS